MWLSPTHLKHDFPDPKLMIFVLPLALLPVFRIRAADSITHSQPLSFLLHCRAGSLWQSLRKMRFVLSQTPTGSSVGEQALQCMKSDHLLLVCIRDDCVCDSECVYVCTGTYVRWGGYSGSRDRVGEEGISELRQQSQLCKVLHGLRNGYLLFFSTATPLTCHLHHQQQKTQYTGGEPTL